MEQARLHMEHLLGHVLHRERLQLYLDFDTPVTPAELQALKSLLQRRAAGEPLWHLLGETRFLDCRIRVTPAALIPRSETEAMVDQVIRAASESSWKRFADLGTGSGCIAIALARHLKDSRIAAVDVSAQALALARENAALNGVVESIRFHEGDMLEFLDGGSPFDCLVANVPYVSSQEFQKLDESVKKYEPHIALSDGGDGTRYLRAILERLPRVLAPKGAAFLEFGFDQGDWMAAQFREFPAFTGTLHPDIHGIPRFACLRHGHNPDPKN